MIVRVLPVFGFGRYLPILSRSSPIIAHSLRRTMASIPGVKLLSGRPMPILGFGTWQAQEEELEKALENALSAGYRHIDTAYVYQNEHVIGKVLKRWLDSGKVKREDLYIVTKLPNIGNRPEHVEKFINLSLSKLQLSYVDLYLIHTPFGLNYTDDDNVLPQTPDGKADVDMSTDLIAIWKKMEEQVDAGRTRTIGVSNFTIEQVDRIVKNSRITPVTNQVELHVYLQQRELESYLKTKNITITAYSPLGTGGINNFFKNLGLTYEIPSILANPVVHEVAKQVGKSPAQVLLRHILQRGIAAIPKSTNPQRIKENIDVFNFELNDEQVKKLDNLDANIRLVMFDKFFPGVDKHPEFPGYKA